MTARALTKDDLDALADNTVSGPDSAVALVRREYLKPLTEDDIVFPPTFAGDGYEKTGYAVDKLSDGTLTALIDTVGSQANRMEEAFVEDEQGGKKKGELADLVPQVYIAITRKESDEPHLISIMQAGHRLGDALIRSSALAEESDEAFKSFLFKGDAGPIARLSPTTLVFGAWDSRETGAKLPRLVQATVRAWDVDVLKRSAQYAPPLDYSKIDVFSEAEKEKAEGKSSSLLAERGYVHVPATDSHGGVRVNGDITRDISVNLVALRQLGGGEGEALRRYVLGLALAAATIQLDGYYRQGCLLTADAERPGDWMLVKRDGNREPVTIGAETVRAYAKAQRAPLDIADDPRTVPFDKKKAVADANKKK